MQSLFPLALEVLETGQLACNPRYILYGQQRQMTWQQATWSAQRANSTKFNPLYAPSYKKKRLMGAFK